MAFPLARSRGVFPLLTHRLTTASLVCFVESGLTPVKKLSRPTVHTVVPYMSLSMVLSTHRQSFWRSMESRPSGLRYIIAVSDTDKPRKPHRNTSGTGRAGALQSLYVLVSPSAPSSRYYCVDGY